MQTTTIIPNPSSFEQVPTHMGNATLAAHSTVGAIEVLVPTKPGHCCETKCFKECYFVLQLKSSITKALKHVKSQLEFKHYCFKHPST